MMTRIGYRDRRDAGRVLARSLTRFAHRPDVTVLALPRGGVPVAFEVSQALEAPLDVLLVRKLGVPGHEEYAMGALASGGVRLLNDQVVHGLGLSEATIELIANAEQRELERRERLYGAGRPPPDVFGRTVVLIDDGLATGLTMRAALKALNGRDPAHVVVAVPVGSPEAVDQLRGEGCEVVCLLKPEPFQAVGLWYEDFEQTTDDEVCDLLAKSFTGRA